MHLITTWFGTFLLENSKVMKERTFPKSKLEIAERLKAIDDGKILEEEKELVEGVEMFFVTEKRLEALGGIMIAESIDIPDLAEQYGFTKELQHEAMIELAKMKSRVGIEEDRHIIQAINAIDDCIKTSNLISERLHEWYGIHFPELEEMLKEEEYVKMVADLGERDLIKKELSADFNSVGVEISELDRRAVSRLAQTLREIYKTREHLEKYIEKKMRETAPNLAHIAGPIIGARLIALAGGLKRLSTLPSSTIQVLGAEKAFFRHLKDDSKPPKHGIIFQHPLVHRAPYWQRGKIARAFSGKIAISAKVDFHSKEFIADGLEKEFRKRVEEIRKKYQEKPARRR